MFCPQKVEKTNPKSCILIAVCRGFFPTALTAQNSPELHFRSINSFIQPSLVGSLILAMQCNAMAVIAQE